MASPKKPRARPLLARPGARFTCAGDGVCCEDIHLIGPVSAREIVPLERLYAGVIDRRLGVPLLATDAEGRCLLLSKDDRCTVHVTSERPIAPMSCRRFPFLLVATPDGGRIGTDHRCPCRTLGDRAPIDPRAAESSLYDVAGRLSVDRRVGPRVPIEPRVHVGWARYLEIEEVLLTALTRGRAEDAITVPPFPALDSMTWPQVAFDMADEVPDTRWGWGLRWFAAHIEPARTGAPGDMLQRPWRIAFDRAEKRTPVPEDPEVMLRDYVADVIWSMEWAVRGTLAHLLLELATGVSVVRSVAATLEARGLRPDRAMAEALLIAEVGAVSDAWSSVVRQFVLGAGAGDGSARRRR